MISVFKDIEQLSQAAARLIVHCAQRAAADRGQFTIALAGGHTPRRTYELLASKPLRDEAPWTSFHVFWGDERCVPPSDERSNERMARETWLDQVPIPRGQIHSIECANSPADGASNYEQHLRAALGLNGRLDLVLLGLGTDGHTASLFPRSSALSANDAWAAPVEFHNHEVNRVTMTAPVINRARSVLFLVAGAEKAGVVKAVIRDEADPQDLPARIVQPVDGDLRWYLDESAAADLLAADLAN
jgi:6-phosphogluconolactonase